MKSKSYMKILSLALVVLLLTMLLAGCGGEMYEVENGYESGAPASEEPAEEPAMEAPAHDGYGYTPPVDGGAEPEAAEPFNGGWYRDDWCSGGEEYDDSPEGYFKDALTSPLSTFSADVDTASYSNMRRYLRDGVIPQGVRVEELVNYFDYGYPWPGVFSDAPFGVVTEVGPCPWNENNLLAMIGIQGEGLNEETDVASNIVFLLDVSGSMDSPDKLPLLKESFKMLTQQLDENDRVSIVTYASSERIIADGLHGDRKRQLTRAIDNLNAGGSTAGGQALRTAYRLASDHFIEGGNNRIILATDGDFNVGESSDDAMISLIEEERGRGVFISVLGFGMGNLKDSKMEKIADHGNGNYAYIDTLQEAKKVLVDEFNSTMYTIAKDLKLQVEFNPAVVSQYRLIGYNNRRLQNRDFNDDTKDAGDIGAGHSVTAFYEIVPATDEVPPGTTLKYQDNASAGPEGDFMTVKLRYKQPDSEQSRLQEVVVPGEAYTGRCSDDFWFASAVAEFGLILTNSEFGGTSSASKVARRAAEYKGYDIYGLRGEFIDLVETYRSLTEG